VPIADIAAYFHVSEKTANKWLKDAIAHFKSELIKRGIDPKDILSGQD
jgi:DNA-directed RNA polymerase specialized sigma24 family protein